MIKIFKSINAIAVSLIFSQVLQASQFIVELDAPLNSSSQDLLIEHSVNLDQSFDAGVNSYAVFSANDEASLAGYLDEASVRADKISEVIFVVTPTLGRALPADSNPREGHQVFVMERPIPDVGFFGLDKKQAISKGSNLTITKLGEIIEWDHSYLTEEGAYCIYRADSSETLREHGALAGEPIGKITAVIMKPKTFTEINQKTMEILPKTIPTAVVSFVDEKEDEVDLVAEELMERLNLK